MPVGDGTGPLGQSRASIGFGRGGGMGRVVPILQNLRMNVDVLIVNIVNHIKEVVLVTPKNVLNATLK